jgi:6-phosphofructokinase 2
LPTREDTAEFAQSLVQAGVARIIIVARGADGSVLASEQGNWHSVGPPVSVVSTVGAGDSFVGAFTLALAGDEPVEECLRWGVAAASAAVMTQATRLCDREITERLLKDCSVTRL